MCYKVGTTGCWRGGSNDLIWCSNLAAVVLIEGHLIELCLPQGCNVCSLCYICYYGV